MEKIQRVQNLLAAAAVPQVEMRGQGVDGDAGEGEAETLTIVSPDGVLRYRSLLQDLAQLVSNKGKKHILRT